MGIKFHNLTDRDMAFIDKLSFLNKEEGTFEGSLMALLSKKSVDGKIPLSVILDLPMSPQSVLDVLSYIQSNNDEVIVHCDIHTITIPDSVTSIGAFTFIGCYSLTSVTIGNRVTSIDKNAFYNCTSLTSITIPDSVTSIGACAFEHCTSLTGVTIPDSITSIGRDAFGYYYVPLQGRKKLDNFHINCYAGTAGEKYAIDKGFSYTLLD